MTFKFVDAIINIMSYQPGGHCEVLRNLTTIRTRADLQFSKEKKEKRKRNRTRRNHQQLFVCTLGLVFGLLSSQYLFKLLLLLLFPLCEPPLDFFF